MGIPTVRKIIVALMSACMAVTVGARETESLNPSWKFHLGDVSGAENAAYDDAAWRVLDLPHDWAFENGYSEDGAQSDKGGYMCGGIGWYRKSFSLEAEELENSRYFIDFDAVYMNSDVWVNGHHLGKRPYGYVSFRYEITDYVVPGRNLIAVRVDNSLEPSARWYHGCGIYGNVNLVRTGTSYFTYNSTFVKTGVADGSKASVNVSSQIDGCFPKGSKVRVVLTDMKGRKVGTSVVSAGASVEAELEIDGVHLWSVESPYLYTARLTLLDKRHAVDEVSVRFGVRTVSWEAGTGFWLNGENLKLRGVCEHLEGGPVGAAWNESLMRWKIMEIKNMGCNAIRTAHNPQLPVFYDICDEVGILVMDEFFDGWMKKADYDYGMQAFDEWWERDLRETVRRDRNHPCVFIYSLGNETRGKIGAELVKACHEEDPTRLVTSGDSSKEYMDVTGINGNSEKKSWIEKYVPGDKAFIGTETPHTWQVRGFYRTRTWYRDGFPNKKQDPFPIPDLTEEEIFGYDWTNPENKTNGKQIFNSSYDNATVRLTARHNICILNEKPWYSGHFRWTGFDYIGEAGYVHGGWPFRAFMGGALDLAGFRKDLYFLYQSEWRDDMDMVHILPHWTHPDMKEGTEIPVWVYTTGDSAELFLNGKSLGIRHKGREWNRIQCEWMVPWTPGEIKAVAYRDGKAIAEKVMRTAGSPAGLQMSVYDGIDSSIDGTYIVDMSVTDRDGNFHPFGENRIWMNVSGADVLSLENGNPVDVETNYNASDKRAFFGLLRAFVRKKDKKAEIVAGAICGDKSFKQSSEVSVDVKRIRLEDSAVATDMMSDRGVSVRYTVDGTEPGLKSALYTGPFEVSGKTVVKAVVYDGNEKILEMEEKFGYGDGIYWGDPLKVPLVSGDISVSTAKAAKAEFVNFKGSVCARIEKGGSLAWYQENDGGNYDTELSVLFYPCRKESSFSVLVNGKKAGTFSGSGQNTSVLSEVKVKASILSGGNDIVIVYNGGQSPMFKSIVME